MASELPTVAVHPASALIARPRLFAALEAAFEVHIRAWAPRAPTEALVCFGETPEEPLAPHVLLLGEGTAVPGPARTVEFLAVDGLDRRLRGIALHDPLDQALKGVADGEAVLAESEGSAVWLRAARAGAFTHRVSASLPELAPTQALYALLSQRPLAMVALTQFLRELDGAAPPSLLRAGIVFDDPNLRWRRYGFIDYRELVEHADRHDYHAAFAMIPLDAGRVHRPTAELFRSRSDRLSLVLHGNDHLKGELMAPPDAHAAKVMLAQALRRVEVFEQRSGLRVDRAMMPPHGMTARASVRGLAALPFDALYGIHPRPWTSEPPADPVLAGWRPAEFVEGCAVIPRIPLQSSRADIALRAFLDHPVVLYGHHDDVAGGLEPLADAAAIVNGLGEVRWLSSGQIATSNFRLRVRSGVASVRPFARSVVVDLPDGVHTLRVELPEDALAPDALTGWSAGGAERHRFGTDVPLPGGGELAIRLRARADVRPDDVAAPVWRPWPRLRRAATEARDRATPVLAKRSR